MRANQLLHAIGPELRSDIMTWLQSEERPAYKAVVDSLAAARKLRPVFILEKSRAKQAEWLLEQLNTKSNEEVTAQIFQIWLLKGQSKMLITFLDAAGILPHEQVDIWNVTNGNRIQTYALEAPRGSRTIGINGAAARHFAVGDTVIIAAFCGVDAAEARQHAPTVVILAPGNEIKRSS